MQNAVIGFQDGPGAAETSKQDHTIQQTYKDYLRDIESKILCQHMR